MKRVYSKHPRTCNLITHNKGDSDFVLVSENNLNTFRFSSNVNFCSLIYTKHHTKSVITK